MEATSGKATERLSSNLDDVSVTATKGDEKKQKYRKHRSFNKGDPLDKPDDYLAIDEINDILDYDSIEEDYQNTLDPDRDNYNIEEIDLEGLRARTAKAKHSREILDGITKRVILNEANQNNPFQSQSFYKSFMMGNNEKCHLIDTVDLKGCDTNLRFANLKQNKKYKEIEYNQLLECLST